MSLLTLLLACTAASSAPEPAPDPPAKVEPAPPPAPPPPEPLPDGPFVRELAPGLTVAAYAPPQIEDIGYNRVDPAAVERADTRLFVVTIDPAHYTLRYLSVRDEAVGGNPRTAAEWVEEHDLHVAFNPGMFEPDDRATGYTRSGDFVSQPQVRRQRLYRSWFVVGPEGAATLDHVPPQLEGTWIDVDTLPSAFRATLDKQFLVSQSLAVMRDGKGVYPPRKNQWSELAYGTDDKGRVVVVFSRYPYEMRELGARVAALDVGIDALIHGEGGPEASLVVRAGGVEWIRMGSYETGFFGDHNHRLWGLPAVLGASPRQP